MLEFDDPIPKPGEFPEDCAGRDGSNARPA